MHAYSLHVTEIGQFCIIALEFNSRYRLKATKCVLLFEKQKRCKIDSTEVYGLYQKMGNKI